MTQDLYYYESGYIDESYFVYVADAESLVSSSFVQSCEITKVVSTGVTINASGDWNGVDSLTAIISKIVSLSSGLVFQFSQTVTISNLKGADLFAFGEAAIAIQVSVIRTTNIQVTGAYTVTANAERTRYISGSIDSIVNFSASALRTRNLEAAHSAAFSLTADAFKTRFIQVNANLSSVLILELSSSVLKKSEVSLSSVASLSNTITKLKGTSASITSTSSISFTGRKLSRPLLTPTVYLGNGQYGGLVIDSTTKKFGTGSLKFEAKIDGTQPRHTPVYGTSGWIAATDRDTTFKSIDDGVTWSYQGSSFTSSPSDYGGNNALVYLNGLYIKQDDTYMASSPDGVTWTTYTKASTGPSIGLLSYNHSRYYRAYVTNSGTGIQLQYSTTVGGAWQFVNDNYIYAGAVGIVGDIQSSGTRTVVVGGIYDSTGSQKYAPAIMYSSNGTTWTDAFVGASSGGAMIHRSFISLTTDGTTWYAIAFDYTAGTCHLYTSTNTNLSSWTYHSVLPQTSEAIDYVNNILVLICSDGLRKSTNGGTTWSTPTAGTIGYDVYASYKINNNGSTWMYGPYVSYDNGDNWQSMLSDFNVSENPYLEYSSGTLWSSTQTIDFWFNTEDFPATSIGEEYFNLVNLPGTYINIELFRNTNVASGPNLHRIYVRGGVAIQSSALTANTWYHIRLVKSGSTMALYLNGSRQGLGSAGSTSTDNKLYVGLNRQWGSSLIGKGKRNAYYIDELVYTDALLTDPNTTSFTVPTAPFTNTTSTSLLLHFDGSYLDDAPMIAIIGRASISAVSTVSCSVTKVFGVVRANLSSTATISTQAKKTVGTSSNIQSQGFLVTSFGRIRPFVDLEVSSSTLSVSSKVLRSFRASIASQSTIIASGDKLLGPVTASLVSVATQTTSADKASGARVDLQVQAFTQTTVGRLRPGIEFVDTISSLSIQTAVNKPTSSLLDVSSTVTTNITKVFGEVYSSPAVVANLDSTAVKTFSPTINLQVQAFELNDVNADHRAVANLVVTSSVTAYTESGKIGECFVTASSTLDCTITKQIGAITSDLSSSSNLALVPSIIRTESAELYVDGFVVAANGRIRPEVAGLTIDTALVANSNIIASAYSQQIVQSTVSCQVTKQLGVITSQLEANISLHIDGVVLPSGSIASFVIASLTSNANRIRDLQVELLVNAAELSVSTSARGLVANISSSSSLTLTATRIQQASAEFDTVASDITVINKIGNTLIDCRLTSSLGCQLGVVKREVALEVAAATLTASAKVIKGTSVSLSSQSILTANAGKQIVASASLLVEGFELSFIRSIRLDNADSWKIAPDNNYWIVPRDINLDNAIVWRVPQEIRSWTIPTETNYYTVAYEDRNYKIKG
jgi:hypothetical protein